MAARMRELGEYQTPRVRLCVVSLASPEHCHGVDYFSTLLDENRSEGEATCAGSVTALGCERILVWLCPLNPTGGPSLSHQQDPPACNASRPPLSLPCQQATPPAHHTRRPWGKVRSHFLRNPLIWL